MKLTLFQRCLFDWDTWSFAEQVDKNSKQLQRFQLSNWIGHHCCKIRTTLAPRREHVYLKLPLRRTLHENTNQLPILQQSAFRTYNHTFFSFSVVQSISSKMKSTWKEFCLFTPLILLYPDLWWSWICEAAARVHNTNSHWTCSFLANVRMKWSVISTIFITIELKSISMMKKILQ